MANWAELARIKNDPVFVRALAQRLLRIEDYKWTGTALAFLTNMARLDSVTSPRGGFDSALSTRQAELLLDLCDESDLIHTFHGFAISRLIEQCFLARLDLNDDDDIDFIVELRQSHRTSIRRSSLWRLLRCCRELGVIEAHEYAA
jgi:hypothetical protein